MLYKLTVYTVDGDVLVLRGWRCHATKSVAGRAFHSDTVNGVSVKGLFGKIFLNLVKDHPELTINASSKTALFR